MMCCTVKILNGVNREVSANSSDPDQTAELQIRGGIEHNSKIIFLISQQYML